MGTNILRIGLLITATQFMLSTSCNKDGSKPCANYTPYGFNVTSEFNPQREIYNVGDTIFLNSLFPKTLLDNISNQNIDYSNSINISGNFNTIYMDTITHAIQESFNRFSVSVLKGQQSPITNSPNLGINIFYFENPSNYQFQMSIKLLAKGLFYIGVTNLSSQGLVGKNCTNAGFNMTVTNSNKNINLFQYALGYTPDALLQKSIYCFRVQ